MPTILNTISRKRTGSRDITFIRSIYSSHSCRQQRLRKMPWRVSQERRKYGLSAYSGNRRIASPGRVAGRECQDGPEYNEEAVIFTIGTERAEAYGCTIPSSRDGLHWWIANRLQWQRSASAQTRWTRRQLLKTAAFSAGRANPGTRTNSKVKLASRATGEISGGFQLI